MTNTNIITDPPTNVMYVAEYSVTCTSATPTYVDINTLTSTSSVPQPITPPAEIEQHVDIMICAFILGVIIGVIIKNSFEKGKDDD